MTDETAGDESSDVRPPSFFVLTRGPMLDVHEAPERPARAIGPGRWTPLSFELAGGFGGEVLVGWWWEPELPPAIDRSPKFAGMMRGFLEEYKSQMEVAQADMERRGLRSDRAFGIPRSLAEVFPAHVGRWVAYDPRTWAFIVSGSSMVEVYGTVRRRGIDAAGAAFAYVEADGPAASGAAFNGTAAAGPPDPATPPPMPTEEG